jgi:hypothetical protein
VRAVEPSSNLVVVPPPNGSSEVRAVHWAIETDDIQITEAIQTNIVLIIVFPYSGLFFFYLFPIAALTREHVGWGQAEGLITVGERSRVKWLVPAQGAGT